MTLRQPMLYILYTLHEENMVIYSNELCKLFDILRGDFLQTRVFFGKSLKTKQPGLREKYLDAILVLQVFQKYLRKISIFTHFFACLMRKNVYI